MKTQNPKLKTQKLLGVFVFLLGFLILNSSSVRALPPQNPTPIQERENWATSEGKLEEKIQQIREAVKERVREKIEEVKRDVSRAYVGEITQIGESDFTLDTRRQVAQIKVTSETKIIGKNKQTLEFKELKVDNFCIAMGYPVENGILEAKRIVVISKPKPPAREVAVGRVTDISAEEKILTVKNDKKGLIYTIQVTEKTIITKKGEKGIEKVKFSTIEINDWIIAIGTPTVNEEKIITAKIIHVIPGKALEQEKPTPTQKLSPTPEE